MDNFYVGVGQITLAGVLTEHPDEFRINIETEEFTRRNSGTVGGGNAAKFTRISNIGIEFNTANFDKSTLADALRALTADEAPGAISENTTAVSGGIAVIDDLLDTSQTVTVADNAGTWAATTDYALDDWVKDGTHLYKVTVAGTSAGSSPTFPTDGSTVVDGGVTWQDMGAFAAVLDTDFKARGNGVFIIEGGGIPDGAPITVDGTRYGHSRVEIGTKGVTRIPVAFDGVNEETSEPITGLFHLVSFDPATVQLVTAEYGAIDMVGEALQDSNVAAGRSGFGTLRVGDATIV